MISRLVPFLKGLKRPTPVAVSFVITNRCNYRCPYCGRWRLNTPELSTREVKEIIDELHRLGMRFLQITGGEPLLREDLEEVLGFAKAKGIYVGVNTNGSLLPGRKEILALVDALGISLDGPREVHDALRGKGAYDKALEAARIAREAGVSVGFTATITTKSWDSAEELLRVARDVGAKLAFQPAYEEILSLERRNPLAPTSAMVREIFSLKNLVLYHDVIDHTPVDAAFMRLWPQDQGLECAGGQWFFRIETNGDVLICGIADKPGGEHPNVVRQGLQEALLSVPRPPCKRCYNHTRLKLNILYTTLKRGPVHVMRRAVRGWR